MGSELWDASREVANWNLADAYDSTWKTATVYKPKLTLSAQIVEPNRLFRPINPTTIQELPGGNYRDMELNSAGCTEIRPVAGPTKATACTKPP